MVLHAVSHGERLLGDPALAANLFEEAAATVSKVLKEKVASGKPPIRDIRGYLFRTYLRRISAAKRAQLVLEDAREEKWVNHTRQARASDVEREILVKELLESCDTVTREIMYRRLAGFSWKEIEKSCGVPVNAANLRFGKTLRRLQKVVGARGRQS